MLFFVHKKVYIYKIPYVSVCKDECKYMKKNLEGFWWVIWEGVIEWMRIVLFIQLISVSFPMN